MNFCLRATFFYALVVILWVSSVSGRSDPARPLKRLSHPLTISLEILPKQSLSPFDRRVPSSTLRYDDSFRLVLSAFDQVFHLHLRPNDHLIHPAARVTYYTSDGRAETKPLLRESVKAYYGEVVDEEYSYSRMREDASLLSRPHAHSSEIGWARIMVHDQGDARINVAPVFEGAFSANGIVHHVMTKDNYLRNKHTLDPDLADQDVNYLDSHLVIWRESDVMTPGEEYFSRTGRRPSTDVSPPHSCGHDDLSHNINHPILQTPNALPWSPFDGLSLTRRDDVVGSSMSTNFADRINNTDGCPKTQKLLYMGVAGDCEYVSNYGSHDNATQQILTNLNSASALYKSTFNVSLGIIELQVQDPTCPTTANSSIPWNVNCDNVDLNDRLSLFSQWRGAKGNDSVGLWHLMSGCPTGTEVGIAWLGTLCQQSSSGDPGSIVSGTAVSTAGRTEWQVVAHEVGHNFGAIHDCADGCNSTSGCCPLNSGTCDANAQFIMSPVAESTEKVFSPCSLGNICSVMGALEGNTVDATCLIDAIASTQTLISLQMCGNGIVEAGEDCDPGSGSNSTCCDVSTCKFTSGAVCDPQSSSCCTDQCSFAPATQVCRAAKDAQCDTAETCTGTSSACPADVFAPNGKSCGNDGLACASGQCTSVSLQCQTVGASMNLTTACPTADNTCQISCQNPAESNQCVLLSATLIEGSPCGYGGTCTGGNCQAGSALHTAEAWYRQNLQIAIPVTVVVGIIVLALLWVLFRSIRRCVARRRSGVPPSAFAAMRPQRVLSYDTTARGIVPPVVPIMTRPPKNQSQWVDESAYNGPRPISS